MHVLGQYARGAYACNLGSPGGSKDPVVHTLPGVTVREKGLFGKLWDGVKRGANNAWNWAKGIEFDFKFSAKITFGAQVGLSGELGGREVGGNLNLAAIELMNGEVAVGGPITSAEGTVTGSGIWEKDGMYNVTQGVDGGVGLISAGIERQFTAGTTTPNDQVTRKIGIPILNVENTIPLSKDAQIAYPNQAHLEAEVNARFLIGIQIGAKIGIRHK